MTTEAETAMHTPTGLPASPTSPLPASAFQRLRGYVNRGGLPRRRLELGLVVVLSGLVLTVANGLWQPKPRETVGVAAVRAPANAAPPSCDDPAVMDRFTRSLEKLEVRSAARDTFDRETLETFAACARREAAAPGSMNSLHTAARSGRLRTVRWLLGTATVSQRDLNRAVLEADPYPDVVALLRSRGAQAPRLLEAAGTSAPNGVRAALEKHADESELSPALGLLLRRVAICSDCNQREYAREQVRVVGLLLAKGAIVDGDGLAALCEHGKEMIDANFETALAHRRPGAVEGALGKASAAVPEPILRRIAAEGVDWGYRDGEDDAPMPLVHAVANRNEGLVRLLVELGAPIDLTYKDGSSALQAAVACGEGDTACGRITEFLLAQGADPNRRFPDGTTPLFAAAEGGNGRVVRALIDAGARLETRVVRETSLDAAERTGNTLAARILAARGARVRVSPY